MKYNRDLAMDYILRKLIGITFTMTTDGDPLFIHELFGEEVGGFFFLLENLRTKSFFTCKPESLITVIELPTDPQEPNVDNE